MELSKEVDVCFDSSESNEKRNCYETESERELFFEKMNVSDDLNANISGIVETRYNSSVASVTKADFNVDNRNKDVERRTKSSDASAATTSSNEMTGIRLRNREKRKTQKVDIIFSNDREIASVVKRCRRRKNDSTKVNVSTNNSKKRKVGDKNESDKLLRSGKKKLEFDNEKKTKEKVKSKSSKCQVFFCEKCDKVYDQYSELVYHERRHTGEKPFLCTWPGCKKAFSASNARVRHMRTHTGEKPYVCPLTECGRRFTYWKDLKLHKYRHTGEKPHKCDWEGCSARFFRKDDLKHHRYTHTGEKPYKCTWQGCVAAFSQKSPLNLHVRKTHKNEIVSKNAAAVATNCVNPSSVLLPNYQTQNLPSVTASNILYTQQPVNSNILVTHSHSSFNTPVIGVSTANTHENLLLSCRMSNPNVSHNISSTIIAAVNPWNVQESYHENNLPQEQTTLRHLPTNFDTQKSVSPEHFQAINNSTLNALNQITTCESIELQQPNCINSMSITNSSGRENDFKNCSINSSMTKDLVDSLSSVAAKPKLREVSLGPDSVDFRYLNNQPVKISVPPVSIDASIGEGNVDASNENIVTPTASIPVRKRANYRLKVQPAEVIKNSTNVSKVTTVRKQTKKANEDSMTKRAAKRTIAVQTVKRSIQKNEKGTLHECDICNRKFKAKHDRDCHRMTHTGEKPRACDWPGCDYRCITKSKLIRHKRKHTGERNYPCDWPGCEKKFATSRHMKEHRRSHTGEKPFKCDWPGCDKWFSRKDHIKNHRYTHTGEKPRKCPYPGCESAFIQLSPLKKHMELHKRDGGCVPNRTRRRKTVNNETMKNSSVSNTAPIPVSTDTVVNIPAISEHSSTNFGVIGIQENPNCCIAGYEAVNPAIHLDYEVILRANYC